MLNRIAALQAAFEAWLEDHPRGTERVLFGGLLLALLGIGLMLALVVVILVLFVWGISREMAITMGLLTLAFWMFSAGLLFSLRNTDHAYSWRLKRWIRKAEAGMAEARWKLVTAYGTGDHGVRKDPAARLWWLRRLAETGDAAAMRELAQALKEGHGVLRDRGQAKAWLERAAVAGDREAVELQAGWAHEQEAGPSGDEGA